MRWDELFTDLELQLDELEAAELAAEVADRTRRETSALRLCDRLGPCRGGRLSVTVAGSGPVSGVLTDLGADWLLLEEAGRIEVLLNAAAVLSVSGLSFATQLQEGEVWHRLDLRWALRGLARSRVAVQVVLHDGSSWFGTIDRVGADHLELAEHAAGEERRRAAVRKVVLLAMSGVSLVRNRT